MHVHMFAKDIPNVIVSRNINSKIELHRSLQIEFDKIKKKQI